MKGKRKRGGIGIRVQFFTFAMTEFIVTIMLAYLLQFGIETLLDGVPKWLSPVLLLIFSAAIGSTITAIMIRTFLTPITRLEKAMREVAGGNFQIELQSNSKLRDIQDIYSNFNLMVRELNANEMLQTDFISNVSHEFKTPINAIEGYASLLQDPQQSREEQEHYVEAIMVNTGRLSSLVRNILLLSKVNNQNIPFQKSSFRIDEQIRQAIVALEGKWASKDIDFDVELEEIICVGYESLLFYVWTNLIDNAIKFNPQGGWIRLRMRRAESGILFTIEDNGPGVPAEERTRIFHKFYQSDSSREMEGNGLGLALVKRIVTLCEGSVEVDAATDGGCRFSVSLPYEGENINKS